MRTVKGRSSLWRCVLGIVRDLNDRYSVQSATDEPDASGGLDVLTTTVVCSGSACCTLRIRSFNPTTRPTRSVRTFVRLASSDSFSHASSVVNRLTSLSRACTVDLLNRRRCRIGEGSQLPC